MSKLLRKACEEAKEGNKDIVNKVRHIGNKFLNAVEISAQEAVYLVLQMPLRRSSREFQFINHLIQTKEHSWLKVWIKLRDYPTIPLILSQIMLLKDIKEDRRNWKIYVWQILLHGLIVKVKEMRKKQ